MNRQKSQQLVSDKDQRNYIRTGVLLLDKRVSHIHKNLVQALDSAELGEKTPCWQEGH